MSETLTAKQTVAVIDIGTSGIRMIVAEIGAKSDIRYLENLQKPVRFGKDVFTSGRISNSAMREAVEILNNYKSVAQTYGVNRIQAIATSAVREASNGDEFVERVREAAGIDIEVISGPEEARLIYLGVMLFRKISEKTS